MPGTKTLRGNVTIWAVRPEAVSDWTAAISLAEWDAADAAGLITDISQAVEDGYKLNLTGSKTDNSQSVEDVTQVETPVYDEYEASLDIFRNKPGSTGTPAYDIALSLFDHEGIEYYLVKRVDKTQHAAVEVGDILSAYGVSTDIGQDITDDGSMLMFGARFKTTGTATTDKTVTA